MIVYCCGRKIKILDGTHTQTVNIYSKNNKHGEYDFIIRMHGPQNFVKDYEIDGKFLSIIDLIDYLKEKHGGIVEKYNYGLQSQHASPHPRSSQNPQTSKSSPSFGSSNYTGVNDITGINGVTGVTDDSATINNTASTNSINSANIANSTVNNSVNSGPKKENNFKNDEWLKFAVPEVENIINEFLKKFIKYPYLHRVEHSIHCELYNMLECNQKFNQHLVFDHTSIKQIHKEWPEYIPRQNKIRGKFDLAILSPENLKEYSLGDYLQGRIEAPIVIEIGLNYKMKHFLEDLAKLSNSNVYMGYLIHLARKEMVDNDSAIESQLLQIRDRFQNIKAGYVRHNYNSVRYKLLNENEIKTIGGSLKCQETIPK
jgi:hypothetical protein